MLQDVAESLTDGMKGQKNRLLSCLAKNFVELLEEVPVEEYSDEDFSGVR